MYAFSQNIHSINTQLYSYCQQPGTSTHMHAWPCCRTQRHHSTAISFHYHLHTHLMVPLLIINNLLFNSKDVLSTALNIHLLLWIRAKCVGSWAFTQPVHLLEWDLDWAKVLMDLPVHWCWPHSKYLALLEAQLLMDFFKEQLVCICLHGMTIWKMKFNEINYRSTANGRQFS